MSSHQILTGMPIAVDAFCYGAIPRVTAYFLTSVLCLAAS
jgi:DNA cross-link repair 1A protein